MKTIYKYPLSIMSHSSVYMPVGAKILKVGEQDSQVFVWAIVDGSSYRNEHYNLRVFGTGHLMDINGGAIYLY